MIGRSMRADEVRSVPPAPGMSVRDQRFVGRLVAAAARAVPDERVEAVGLLGTVGATRSSQLMFVNVIYGLLLRRRGRRCARGFPLLCAMIVTPNRLVFVVYRPRYRLGRRVVEMDRRVARLSVRERGSKRWDLPTLLIRNHDATVELEIRQAGPFAAVNASLLRELNLVPAEPALR